MLGLLSFDYLILNHGLDVLWVVLRDISNTFATRADESFKSQVVACRKWVVLVGFNEATSVLTSRLIKWVFFKNDLKLAEINWNRIRANDDSWIIFDIFDLSKPRVGTDIASGESFIRVSVQDLLKEVAAVITNEFRDGVLSIQNLFVQDVCFRVFKG